MEINGKLHTLGKEPPQIHGIGSWMGFVVGLDAMAKRKIPCLSRESNPLSPNS
jgi:hypothetical protein